MERGAAIVVPDKTLAVKVNVAMRREDWSELRGYIVGVMEEFVSDISGNEFDLLCKDFECEKLSEVLYDKVKAEYDKFIIRFKIHRLFRAEHFRYEFGKACWVLCCTADE